MTTLKYIRWQSFPKWPVSVNQKPCIMTVDKVNLLDITWYNSETFRLTALTSSIPDNKSSGDYLAYPMNIIIWSQYIYIYRLSKAMTSALGLRLGLCLPDFLEAPKQSVEALVDGACGVWGHKLHCFCPFSDGEDILKSLVFLSQPTCRISSTFFSRIEAIRTGATKD